MNKVLIIGGGAAGMLSAIGAADYGADVHLFEKNDILGKKLFITGKGRCNITNNSDINTHFENIIRNSKFLYSAYNCLDCNGICDILKKENVTTITERGGRVFPKSGKSSDVIKALKNAMSNRGVAVHTQWNIADIASVNGKIIIKDKNERTAIGDACVVATGGVSYPSTGSTGDGYIFAKKLGHEVTDIYPSLVPMNIKDECCKDMQGLPLKNVALSIVDENGKVYYKDQGEMLFTHFGISGPLVLTAASYISDKIKDHKFKAVIDWKPALDNETLDKRILRDFAASGNKDFINALGDLLPKKAIPVIVRKSGVNSRKKVRDITKEERKSLISVLKGMSLDVAGLRGYNEAIITKGGICVKDIDPKTMESKIVSGVYFAGEVLDIDALTGGYNLQEAWSTGYLSGKSAAMKNMD